MAYRHEGNDPTRSRHLLSPAEVKAMMTGGGGGDGPPAPTETPEDEADEVMVWLTGERTMTESRALAQVEGRCGSCGRARDCCCQGCSTCPQSKMAAGMISAVWAKRQVDLGGIDPREMC
jgi:hypothetical protein